LNPQQAAAVNFDHGDGAVLVLAGAGSGKTTVLTRRIARLMLESFPETDEAGPRGILALTFTKDAALEMESRLRKAVGGEMSADRFPRIGTFHAFAFGLIRGGPSDNPNWRRLGFARSPDLCDARQRRAWLVGIRKEIAPDVSMDVLEGWLAHPFEDEEDEGGDGKGEVDVGDDDGKGASRSELRARFREHLKETGSLAFDDMVALALRLLRECPDVLADFRSRTAYVLVDEFQDTSRDQLDLVRVLMGQSRNLFLVGDDDQAIYGFRGADPGNIGAALESFPGMRILKLETNYRSTAPIVAYANSVFGEKARHLRKRLVAGREQPLRSERSDQSDRSGSARRAKAGPAPVRKIIHGGGAEQARWMAGEMSRLRNEEGLQWGDIAILYRLNVLEAYYRSLLERLIGPEAAGEVVLSTVHGAKGLEYPAVFFVGLEDGILPYRRRGEPLAADRLAEERRIFYVGVTRAQRFLYLCAARKRVLRGKTVESDVSPFLRGPILAALRRWTSTWIGKE
jgi:DNA helicase-2/ATP-dependent DNA helicase PcrA